MSFLPEDDQEFLAESGIMHEELTERTPEGSERRGVLFPGFAFVGNLRGATGGTFERCDLLVLLPNGYATTKLDSFYTVPRLKRADGTDPQSTGSDTPLFQKTWQFWSRHLDDKDWRVGIDGLRTFLPSVPTLMRQFPRS